MYDHKQHNNIIGSCRIPYKSDGRVRSGAVPREPKVKTIKAPTMRDTVKGDEYAKDDEVKKDTSPSHGVKRKSHSDKGEDRDDYSSDENDVDEEHGRSSSSSSSLYLSSSHSLTFFAASF